MLLRNGGRLITTIYWINIVMISIVIMMVHEMNAKLTIPMFDHHGESSSLTYVTSNRDTFKKFADQLLNSNNQENHHERGNIYASPSNGYYTESESIYHKTETMLLEKKGDFVRTRSIARTMKRMSWKALWQLSKDQKSKSIKTQFGNKAGSVSSDPMPPDHRRNWVPSYVGQTLIDGKSISWSYAPCFHNTSARITKIDAAKKSVTLEFETSGPVSYLCYDWYFITTRENYFIKVLFTHGKHELVLEHLNDDGEWDDVLQNGLRIFYFKDAIFQTVIDAFNAGKLLAGMYFEKDKMSFLKRDMGFEFNERPIKQIYLEDYELESGDVVMQLQLSGLDCLLMYGTGARTGHIASILKIDGIKYVVESTEEGVRKTPWQPWYNANQGDSTIIIARMAPEYRKLYNESAAVELFKTLEGNEYGYVNIAYAWIDTEEDNYPHPLSGDMIGATFVLFNNWYMGSAINLLFLKGMNQRLQHYYGINANCTNVMCVFDYLTKLNITINYALALPERDGWLYDGKPMMVCSVMYMNLLKVSGIFGNLTNQLESSEFTPKDIYQMGIWDLNWRPEKCNANNDNLPYCQVAGPWYWKLDNFSTVKPYARMNERCGAEPMDYVRHPEFC